ncbi:MAG: cobalt-factor II C(20)-methyltransferase [Thermoproteus sp.]
MLKVVGLGPGDPELVTIKAARVLERADVVFIPKSTKSEASLARRVLAPFVRGEVVELEFSMGASSAEEARKNAEIISKTPGERAYAVLGDPSLYSTFARLRPYLEEPVEYVPGVSAILSCSLRAGRELAVGDQAIAIVPATRADLLARAAELFNVVVVVKANKNVELINTLMSGRGVAVRRCYLEGEAVGGAVAWDDYFTTVYIWR